MTEEINTNTPPEAPQRDKLAIVGFSSSSLSLAPVDDESWEIWGLNQLWRTLPRWDVWFDLHPRYRVNEHADHLAWLQRQEKPILMQDHYEDIPASLHFPKDELVRHFGTYFTSSIAWMLGFAVMQKRFRTIGIWGVDMLGDSEYAYQMGSCAYFIGYCRGLGIGVHVPDESALLKSPGLYGYEWQAERPTRYLRRYGRRKRKMQAQKDECLQAIYMLDGALMEVKDWNHERDSQEWCEERIKSLNQRREEAFKALYTLDGAIQEVGDAITYEKHYRRGGA